MNWHKGRAEPHPIVSHGKKAVKLDRYASLTVYPFRCTTSSRRHLCETEELDTAFLFVIAYLHWHQPGRSVDEGEAAWLLGLAPRLGTCPRVQRQVQCERIGSVPDCVAALRHGVHVIGGEGSDSTEGCT